jgi:hypothetical protein
VRFEEVVEEWQQCSSFTFSVYGVRPRPCEQEDNDIENSVKTAARKTKRKKKGKKGAVLEEKGSTEEEMYIDVVEGQTLLQLHIDQVSVCGRGA